MYEGQLRVHLLGRVPMKYIGFARKKLEELYEQAAGGSLTKYFRTGTGCRIKVSVVGDDGYIRVKCGACPKLVHGLMDPIVDISHPNALYEDTIDGETVETFHRFYEKEETAWANVTSLRTSGPQSLTKRPGLYSGLMRKVVQALLGSNQQVQYDYGFTKTHGIYTDAAGRYHVIEISSAGVYSWPLPACTASESVTGLTVTPLYASLAAGRPSNALQIADASDVADAYNKNPIFSGCGWAFSYNGSKASNVVYTTSGSYYVSYLYTISIVENEDGPTDATMSEVETDIMWGDQITHFKVPNYEDGTLESFDWTTTPSEPGSDDTAPVHCWYDDESLIVCRFVRIQNAAFSSTTDTIEYRTVTGGLSAVPIPGGTAENISGTQETRSFSISGFVDAVASRTYTGSISYSIELDSWSNVFANGGFNTSRDYTDVVASGIRNLTSASLTEEYIEALILAYGDREAAFHARQYSLDGTADEEITQVGFWGHGQAWGSASDPLNAGSHDWSVEIAAGDITPPGGADTSIRAHNIKEDVGSVDGVGGIASTIVFYEILTHSGYYYGRAGTPEEIGAIAYATTANEDQYGADPCFTGTTRIADIGLSSFTLQTYQSYISYSTTLPCTGPAETTGQQVRQVDEYWFTNGVSVTYTDYEQASTPAVIDDSTKTATLIRNSGATDIEAGAADFTSTWCQFLDPGDIQIALSIPDCVGSKSAYLDGLWPDIATFPTDMLGGSPYPVTELTNLHACFIGTP